MIFRNYFKYKKNFLKLAYFKIFPLCIAIAVFLAIGSGILNNKYLYNLGLIVFIVTVFVFIGVPIIIPMIITVLALEALLLMLLFSPCLLILYYSIFYYKGKKFLKIKNSVEEYVTNCNELNEHIEELKESYVNIKKTYYGVATFKDNSNYKFKRSEQVRSFKSEYIYDCSRQICRNASNQPFKYLCKYFNIENDEYTLEKFEKVLNDFLAVEEGKELLEDEINRIKESILDDIPWVIRTFSMNKFMTKLGFEPIKLNTIYFPVYSFRYISPGGNKSERYDIELNIENLSNFIKYLSNLVTFRKSIAGQRALMTPSLREKIKQRDDYTCQKCGISIEDEQHLLLEIDHIIPLSKGGMSTEENLQTLCWKCNREKGSKVYS